jgi:ribosome modulation factor
MNDNGAPEQRSDPFGRGLAAHRDHVPRGDCPYPAPHVEARRWLAGWDHARFKDADASEGLAGRIGGDDSERHRGET